MMVVTDENGIKHVAIAVTSQGFFLPRCMVDVSDASAGELRVEEEGDPNCLRCLGMPQVSQEDLLRMQQGRY